MKNHDRNKASAHNGVPVDEGFPLGSQGRHLIGYHSRTTVKVTVMICAGLPFFSQVVLWSPCGLLIC